MIVMQTNQLTKSFGVNEVLKGINLTVQDRHRVERWWGATDRASPRC